MTSPSGGRQGVGGRGTGRRPLVHDRRRRTTDDGRQWRTATTAATEAAWHLVWNNNLLGLPDPCRWLSKGPDYSSDVEKRAHEIRKQTGLVDDLWLADQSLHRPLARVLARAWKCQTNDFLGLPHMPPCDSHLSLFLPNAVYSSMCLCEFREKGVKLYVSTELHFYSFLLIMSIHI